MSDSYTLTLKLNDILSELNEDVNIVLPYKASTGEKLKIFFEDIINIVNDIDMYPESDCMKRRFIIKNVFLLQFSLTYIGLDDNANDMFYFGVQYEDYANGFESDEYIGTVTGYDISQYLIKAQNQIDQNATKKRFMSKLEREHNDSSRIGKLLTTMKTRSATRALREQNNNVGHKPEPSRFRFRSAPEKVLEKIKINGVSTRFPCFRGNDQDIEEYTFGEFAKMKTSAQKLKEFVKTRVVPEVYRDEINY